MSTVSVYPAPPPTRNTLSATQRTQLIRTTSKLGRVLGSTPTILDLHLAEDALGDPALFDSAYAFPFASPALSTSSPTKPRRHSALFPPASKSAGEDYLTDILNLYAYSSSSSFDLPRDAPPRTCTPSPACTSASSDSLSLHSLSSDSSLDLSRASSARPSSALLSRSPASVRAPSPASTPSRSPRGAARKRAGSLPALFRPGRAPPFSTPPRSTDPRPTLTHSPASARRASVDGASWNPEGESAEASPLAPAFRIPSDAALRRAKMERLRKRLGECVPVELVFPSITDTSFDEDSLLEHDRSDEDHVRAESGGSDASARSVAEAQLGVATKVDLCRAAPVLTRASKSLGDVRDVGAVLALVVEPMPREEEAERHLAQTRVPFLWRTKLEVIVEGEAGEDV